MTALAIQARGTYDEARDTPRPCPCGRHLVTGYWSRLTCPWYDQSWRLFAQPEEQPTCE